MGEASIPYCENADTGNDIIGYMKGVFYKYACLVANYIGSCIDLLPLIQEIMSPPDYFRLPYQLTKYF
jgi:hypothetical protein